MFGSCFAFLGISVVTEPYLDFVTDKDGSPWIALNAVLETPAVLEEVTCLA